MGCPACGEALVAGQERCPSCGASVAPSLDGALAPELLPVSSPAKLERLRDVPSFKKREPSWKDEVRERMKHRRRRVEELPLFREEASEPPVMESPALEESVTEEPPPPQAATLEAAPLEHEPEARASETESGFIFSHPVSEDEEPETEDAADVMDLPLRSPTPMPELALPETDLPAPLEFPEPEPPALAEPNPVERPAFVGERMQAAALDVLTLGVAAALVVYFAARAAHVSPRGLMPAWPYLASFLVFFGLAYAAFFTGLTGQTLGKMLLRLRVVDTAGAPPGHWRAALRAALGTIGSLALVGVAPMFVDPARRALHDRLLRTRVVRS